MKKAFSILWKFSVVSVILSSLLWTTGICLWNIYLFIQVKHSPPPKE